MQHIEMLAERILFLKGDVEMKQSAAVEKIHDVEGMLKKAKALEDGSITHYNEWAKECSAHNDSISKQLFEKLVADEETHYDEFDIEIDNMGEFGENYLALQSIVRSNKAGAGVEE